MKVLSDFDGVLTDLTEEAARVRRIFSDSLEAMSGGAAALLAQAEARLNEEPHRHGWRSNGRITAHCNEDGFIRVNGLAACLDELAGAGHGFSDLAQAAYTQMVRETAAGKHNPLDEQAVATLVALLERRVEVVIVSNSSTDRIEQLLSRAGLPTSPRLRVRGNARKFVLGSQSRCLNVDPYKVEVDRPAYEAILREEKPDVVVGDVFSLDLALPAYLGREGVGGFEATRLALRRREYTPQWSLDLFENGWLREVNGVVLDGIEQLVDLA